MHPPSEISQILWNRIRDALLHEWDPIGIQEYPGAHDEYDSYVADVYRMLSLRSTEEDILIYLWSLETEHMGLRGERARTEAFAKRLLEIRNEVLGGI
jgi:hypothetical protein